MFSCPVCKGKTSFLYEKKLEGSAFSIFRCADCGLGFVNPIPTNEELQSFYEKNYYNSNSAWGYHTPYEELESGLKKIYKKLLSKCGHRLSTYSVKRVLDVGCAYGYFLDVAKEELQPEVTVGLDVTSESASVVLEKGHFFVSGLFEDSDLPFKQFDLIFMGDVFEHLRNPEAAAKKLSDMLSSNGLLILTTVNFKSWLARFLGSKWRLMTPPEHLFFWTPQSIKLLFGKYGFNGDVKSYWLYYPKSYVFNRFKEQFGFYPLFLKLWPNDLIPIPSFDVFCGFFWKKG